MKHGQTTGRGSNAQPGRFGVPAASTSALSREPAINERAQALSDLTLELVRVASVVAGRIGSSVPPPQVSPGHEGIAGAIAGADIRVQVAIDVLRSMGETLGMNSEELWPS